MDLTLKTVPKIVRQCLVERTLSPLAGHCLYIELYGSDIGLEFWTRLWHYLVINAGPCGVLSGVHCDICRGLSTVDTVFGVLWGSWIRFGYYFKVCNIFD